MVLKISSDLDKFLILHTPYDCEPINRDLIDKLLSPLTVMVLLKFLIFFNDYFYH